MEILPFTDEMLAEAARVLAGQQGRLRQAFADLPARFANQTAAMAAVQSLWAKKDSEGFGAFDDGRMVAFLTGRRLLDNPFIVRGGWVDLAGCAYDAGFGVEIMRDLYAALGRWWVSQGIFSHIVMASVFDADLLQAMFSLGFGIEQVHGLINLDQVRPQKALLPPNMEIRRVEAQDRQALADLSRLIWQEQVGPPVWGVMLPEVVGKTAAGWAGLVDDEAAIVWLGLIDGRVMGMQAYWPVDDHQDALYIPDRCLNLSVAATRPEARGRGLGTMMTQTGLAFAHQEGFYFCEADWRSTNLQASRFWPKRGFQAVVYRLARRIDDRIAWAKGASADGE